MKKHLASIITAGRIAGSFLLFIFEPLSPPFFAVYILCCLSDILDGFIARKTETVSKLGEILDSIADFVFIAVVLFVFLPLIPWEAWMLWWMGAIALIRLMSLVIGFIRFHAFAFLHTYANKVTGIALAFFPIFYSVFGLNITMIFLYVIAALSALEELFINIRSKELNRNTKGLFDLPRREKS